MIKVHVLDAAALSARTPAELSIYLRVTGWRLDHRTAKVAYWVLPVADDELEILQPLDPDLRDYASRIGDALVVLAAVEQRSELEILRQISGATWDVHTVSMFPPDEAPGMIGLDDAVAAHEGMRGLVSAAAYPLFTQQSRAVQPARKPQALMDFLRTVRIGPAAEGSYLLTAHMPVPPRLTDQPSLFDNDEDGIAADEPSQRQVSLQIYRAVKSAHEAADAALLTGDGLDRFTGAVPQGVSANLCEALAGFGGDLGHPFELSVSLAVTRRNNTPLPPVRFRRDQLPVLKEAAAQLRARTPEEDVTVTGEVVRLHREGPATGEITLVGRLDESDVLRRIWVDLPAAEYEAAARAHQEMRQVKVHGSLVRRGTRYYLSGPSGFNLLPATD